MNLDQLDFSVSKKWRRARRENRWMSFVPETARDSEGNEFMRKEGGTVIYKKLEKGYECTTCGLQIMSINVSHQVGFESTNVNETVPYCPRCEGQPDPVGEPI